MATLYLDHINRSIPILREWLDGEWGLLLSHPDDFEDHSIERERWLEVIQQEFRASGVKPIVYRHRSGEPDRGWVGRVTGDERRVRLTHSDVIDSAARRLRDVLVEVPAAHFAMMVDPALICRGVLMYQRSLIAISPVGPLDLLGPIAKLR